MKQNNLNTTKINEDSAYEFFQGVFYKRVRSNMMGKEEVPDISITDQAYIHINFTFLGIDGF
jgi:hypothetical protein